MRVRLRDLAAMSEADRAATLAKLVEEARKPLTARRLAELLQEAAAVEREAIVAMLDEMATTEDVCAKQTREVSAVMTAVYETRADHWREAARRIRARGAP